MLKYVLILFIYFIAYFFYYNHRKYTCRHFQILAQFSFTTGERELDYYHQKVNIRVAPRVAKRLKTQDLRTLGNFKEIPETLGIDRKVFSRPHKRQISTVVSQNCEKSAVNHFIEKPMLVNFVDLSTIFRPRLQISQNPLEYSSNAHFLRTYFFTFLFKEKFSHFEDLCVCAHFTSFSIPLIRTQDTGFKLCMPNQLS